MSALPPVAARLAAFIKPQGAESAQGPQVRAKMVNDVLAGTDPTALGKLNSALGGAPLSAAEVRDVASVLAASPASELGQLLAAHAQP